ncbi:MAG: dodecin domain-containing protein [Betaproteobacteria bacterium]|nr:MAG: dodecin domain-containing protein [Betaproteobacteria bacterium]
MSVAKVIEISSESTQSFEDAIRAGILEASKSVRNIKSAWVNSQQAILDHGDTMKFRVDLKVSFLVD